MKIQLYQDKAGEHRWRAVSSNGKIMADSGEGYLRKEGMMHSLTVLYAQLPTALADVCKIKMDAKVSPIVKAMEAWENAVTAASDDLDKCRADLVELLSNYVQPKVSE